MKNCFGECAEKMKILLLADYRAGLEVAKTVIAGGDEIAGLVVHPPAMENEINRGYTEQIVQLADLPQDRVFSGDKVHNGECLDAIKALHPDIALVVFWGYILKPELIQIPQKGCINFHLSYLPYNRGKNPNVWPFVEGTTAGVTLHYIDFGVDTGNIIAQEEVPLESIDTAQTLYEKLSHRIIDLFQATWPKIKDGTAPSIRQDRDGGTFHYAKDLQNLDSFDLNQRYLAGDLINLLRARTFPPFPSAYFRDDQGRKVSVRVQLEYADSPSGAGSANHHAGPGQEH